MVKKWIQKAINPKNIGRLRRTAKVKKGQKIPLAKLHELAKKPGKTGRRARLALILRRFK